jgi:hypothetical protein
MHLKPHNECTNLAHSLATREGPDDKIAISTFDFDNPVALAPRGKASTEHWTTMIMHFYEDDKSSATSKTSEAANPWRQKQGVFSRKRGGDFWLVATLLKLKNQKC